MIARHALAIYILAAVMLAALLLNRRRRKHSITFTGIHARLKRFYYPPKELSTPDPEKFLVMPPLKFCGILFGNPEERQLVSESNGKHWYIREVLEDGCINGFSPDPVLISAIAESKLQINRERRWLHGITRTKSLWENVAERITAEFGEDTPENATKRVGLLHELRILNQEEQERHKLMLHKA